MTVEELKKIEQVATELFMDQIAECFDKGVAVSPDTLFEDSDGFAITAEAMLRRIRLHEALDRLCKTSPTR